MAERSSSSCMHFRHCLRIEAEEDWRKGRQKWLGVREKDYSEHKDFGCGFLLQTPWWCPLLVGFGQKGKSELHRVLAGKTLSGKTLILQVSNIKSGSRTQLIHVGSLAIGVSCLVDTLFERKRGATMQRARSLVGWPIRCRPGQGRPLRKIAQGGIG